MKRVHLCCYIYINIQITNPLYSTTYLNVCQDLILKNKGARDQQLYFFLRVQKFNKISTPYNRRNGILLFFKPCDRTIAYRKDCIYSRDQNMLIVVFANVSELLIGENFTISKSQKIHTLCGYR